MPTRSHRRTISYAVSALCALALLSACGGAGDAGSDVGPSTMPSSSQSAQPSGPAGTSPSMPPSGRARPTTMSGEVTSIEGGCVVFRADRDAKAWVLVGETRGIVAGTAYVVDGVAMDAMDPRCPQGLPFHVTTATKGELSEDLTPSPAASGRGAGVITLTGVVADGVETGCRVLQTDAGVFTLVGRVAVPDGRVEVRGVARLDLATTCQQGTAFEVLSARVLG